MVHLLGNEDATDGVSLLRGQFQKIGVGHVADELAIRGLAAGVPDRTVLKLHYDEASFVPCKDIDLPLTVSKSTKQEPRGYELEPFAAKSTLPVLNDVRVKVFFIYEMVVEPPFHSLALPMTKPIP